MWTDMSTRTALLDAASAADSSEVRRQAFRTLANLSEEKENMQPMWGDVETRAVLISGAGTLEPAIKVQALRSLANIAADEGIDRPMWEDEGTRAAVIAGTNSAEEDLRENAFRALVCFASDDENKVEMWADVHGARAVLIAGAGPHQARGSRTHALFALTLMAMLEPLQAELTAAGVREILASGRDSNTLGREEPPQPAADECKQQ
eukprot:gnl/TRDRNA2_/TRDRNA2_167592_c1_seq1.p1 gnl/TRDRNA2_/TRDRNA2_167592_c1~~gnl/TRDRNA2_/TRDRNA2_167592_c1_seq1.p1  ORF type:complete len:207 (+),score=37.11 gnl/TRDRNA2_/TRDRNA2_167592_c1_seq1:285-905(+)